MNKLKIHSAYLPYGLKFSSSMDKPFEDYGLQSIWTLDGINKLFGDYCLLTKENNDAYAINSCKPILFSLEDLTKEITINGETFVPIIELAEIAGLKPFKGEYRMEFLNDERAAFVECKCFEHYGVKQRFAYYNDFGFRATLDGYKPYKQFELFEKLLEWKFNVFNLPEIEYIKVTEENNPYK